MTFDEIAHIADRGTFFIGLIIFILASYTGKIRWGKDYDELKKDLTDCEGSQKAVNDKALAKLERLENLSNK